MTYVVSVEKNFESLKNCIQTLTVPRNPIHTLPGLHLEIARVVEEKYNIKCNLIEANGTLVWNSLEFENEQEYLVWTLKFG